MSAFLQIVSKRSATIGVANEDVVGLAGDHSSICRIKDENEIAYRRIVQDCQKLGTIFSERFRCKRSTSIPCPVLCLKLCSAEFRGTEMPRFTGTLEHR